MQTLHRSRDRLVGERTALINQLRAILLVAGPVRAAGQAEARAVPGRPDGRARRAAGTELRMVLLIAENARGNPRNSIDGSLPSTPSSSAG